MNTFIHLNYLKNYLFSYKIVNQLFSISNNLVVKSSTYESVIIIIKLQVLYKISYIIEHELENNKDAKIYILFFNNTDLKIYCLKLSIISLFWTID